MAVRSLFEQLAIRYCAPRGIRLSEFRDVWSEDDQAAALEWQAEQDNPKCPGCGQPIAECMAHEDDAPDYQVELRRCHACNAKGMEERAMARDGDPGPGLYSIVRKMPDGHVDKPSAANRQARAAS